MAELDPSDPYAREADTFPHLEPELAARVATYGSEETLARGQLVFQRGERSVDFFLVLEGAIEVFQADAHGEAHVIATHRERQFTGELDLFNDRMILVSGRAGTDSRVVRIKRADFRRMVATEADIGEIVMRAFILRRVGFIRHEQGGVVLIGPGHAAATLRLERFLLRNAYPHRVLDTEVDAGAGGFLECFEFGPATMSDYLVQRIESSPRITLHPHTEVTGLAGDERLRRVTWTRSEGGGAETRDVGNLFLMIGAEPNTEWLHGCLELDDKSFVKTGKAPGGEALTSPFATDREGVFAIGDVRAGSVKRVASGVGEGAVVVQAVHRFLNPGVA